MGNMLNRYIHWGRRIYQSIIHMHMASESLCYVKNVVSLILAYSYKISPTFKKKKTHVIALHSVIWKPLVNTGI